MGRATVVDRIASIKHQQKRHARVVIGIYLSRLEVDEIVHLLTADEPPVGALGRLDRTPIFLEGAGVQPSGDGVHFGTLHGIRHEYVQMDVLD